MSRLVRVNTFLYSKMDFDARAAVANLPDGSHVKKLAQKRGPEYACDIDRVRTSVHMAERAVRESPESEVLSDSLTELICAFYELVLRPHPREWLKGPQPRVGSDADAMDIVGQMDAMTM